MYENNEKSEFFDRDMDEYGEKKHDSKPLIAGIILLLAGIMGILTWVVVLSIDVSMIDLSMLESQNMTITPAQLNSMLQICATIGIILSIFPLLGGLFSLQKRIWGGAVACSIIGLFTIGPIFLSSILSLIALILLVMSKEQFMKQKENSDEY